MSWDIFLADRLEVVRGLDLDSLRAALARGSVHVDDLVRPAGTSDPWSRLGDLPGLIVAPGPQAPAPPAPPPAVEPPRVEPELPLPPADAGAGQGGWSESPGGSVLLGAIEPTAGGFVNDHQIDDDASAELIPVRIDEEDLDFDEGPGFDEGEGGDEDEEAGEFTLSRNSAEKIEELDLAAMVDVAFQLVLFFLVTATTVLSKTLEIPKPNPENAPGAVAQGRSRTLDELSNDFIVVEIDAGGAVKVAHEPVDPSMGALTEALRRARESTGHRSILLSADFRTPHRNAVLAYDAANEIGLSIAIARPTPPNPIGNEPAPAARGG